MSNYKSLKKTIVLIWNFGILIIGEIDMKFYEKLIILIVLFLGVTIGTAAIIGVYARTVSENDNQKDNNNSIILENINVLDWK